MILNRLNMHHRVKYIELTEVAASARELAGILIMKGDVQFKFRRHVGGTGVSKRN